MVRQSLLPLVFAFILHAAFAQDKTVTGNDLISNTKHDAPFDTTSLLNAIHKGRLNGHARYFFMATDNQAPLKDYYANAVSLALRYETGSFHHFQLAIGGSSVIKLWSADITSPDSLSGLYNRYETGLFNIPNTENKNHFERLEESYLKYAFPHTFIKLGRQFINTAFINLQDGRMRPTAVEGIWAEGKEIKDLSFKMGWLWNISPRSTTRWVTPGGSFGVYPTGLNPDGTKSGYSNNISSNGIGILQLDYLFNKDIRLQAVNMFVENVMNNTMLQADYTLTLKNNAALFTGLQTIKQYAIKDGGNPDQSKTYILKGGGSLTYGAKIGWKNNQWEASINYNRITTEGRYLVPREWGYEPFFTFLPRERNDGFGNVQAILGKINFKVPGAGLKTSFGAGYYHLPDVKDCVLNKYGLPSYLQLNADIRYTFTHAFKGLEAQLLIAGKLNKGETYNNYKYIDNKVNMVLYNFVMNYYF